MHQSSALHTGSNSEEGFPGSWVATGATQCCVMQENIKDKLSGIPIDVSVEIQEAKRKRRQSSFPQLPPVLDANEENTARSMVSARADDQNPHIQMFAHCVHLKRGTRN